MKKLRSITVVEDRTAASRCDEGFLKLARLRLRNEYADGTCSKVYACDVVSRPGADAVVAVLYEREGRRQVRVLLREAWRAPVFLRRHKSFVHADPREYTSLAELVAGMVEPGDGPGQAGLCRRAAAEAHEEAGLDVPPEQFAPLGDETFASPGMTDEKLYFCAAAARLAQAGEPPGDGTVMEEGGGVRSMELGEAIAACRRGEIPDMKTELGLLRLADHLGYLPQLGCFAEDLPEPLARRHDGLGVARARSGPA